MALTKEVEYKYEILPSGDIQEREKTLILEDGVVIADTNHRRVISPGADLNDESADVKALGKLFHTAEKIAAKTAREAEKTE